MRRAALLLALLPLASRAQEEEREAFAWILTFQNGDTLHCDLLALEARKLRVDWAVTPGTPVAFELAAVSEIRRARPAEPPDPDGRESLRLRDGSLLYGHVVRFSPDGVEFDTERLGRLVLATPDVEEYVRGEPERQVPPQGERHVLLMTNGNLLEGDLEQGDGDRVTLRSETLTASVDYASIAVLLFPTADAAPAPESDVPGVQVRFRDGTMLAGKEPALQDGVLSFHLGSGHQVRARSTDLDQITFLDYGTIVGRMGMRSILVWTRYADKGDELKKTLDIVKDQLKGWRIEEYEDEALGKAFRRLLYRSRTLLIPEMEKWDVADDSALAAEFRSVVTPYLRGGGNVVLCGPQAKQVEWLRATRFMDLQPAGTVDNQNIAFTTEGASLARGLPVSWRAMNATWGYTIRPGTGAQSLASVGPRTVVAGSRVGRGWFLVLGMDFYQTNETASQVLAAAIQLR